MISGTNQSCIAYVQSDCRASPLIASDASGLVKVIHRFWKFPIQSFRTPICPTWQSSGADEVSKSCAPTAAKMQIIIITFIILSVSGLLIFSLTGFKTCTHIQMSGACMNEQARTCLGYCQLCDNVPGWISPVTKSAAVISVYVFFEPSNFKPLNSLKLFRKVLGNLGGGSGVE